MNSLLIVVLGIIGVIVFAHLGAIYTGEFKLPITWKGKKKMITSPPRSFKLVFKDI